MADDDTAATGRDGLEPQGKESAASKESVATPQSSTNTAADEGTSPRSSPKRKPVGLDSDGKGPQRRKDRSQAYAENVAVEFTEKERETKRQRCRVFSSLGRPRNVRFLFPPAFASLSSGKEERESFT
ncbi:hypothetical protein GBAR_LOCUS8849 [Geodia barretti]|uniref:Uncharacterized protein n=1 Tax=Geodia barretti TaxID=519541 RepID=A0AA35RN07_GEOBA|nr:hypothetical protein GBAR_LOCUS8849 [Geodia barretti]